MDKLKDKIAVHKIFIIFMLMYTIFSAGTIMDFPTVDHTRDDMWHIDRAISYVNEGKITQSFFILDKLNNTTGNRFNWNDILNAWSYRFIDQSIFSLRLKSLILGLILLILVYFFSLRAFANKRLSLCAVIILAFTHGFLYRSHDSRPEILMALMYFIFFWISYRMIVDRASAAPILWPLLLGLIPAICFRQIHPNGVIFYLVAFGVFLIFYPKSLIQWKSWIGFLSGILIYFILAALLRYGFEFNLPTNQSANQSPEGINTDMLNWIPIYKMSDFSSFSSVLSSAYHIAGLMVKYPPRFLSRINYYFTTGYIDAILFGLSFMALLVNLIVLRRLSYRLRFYAAWIILHLATMSLISGSSTDYSLYIIPVMILVIVAAVQELADKHKVRAELILRTVIVLQILFALFVLGKLKFYDRYYDNLKDVRSILAVTIPDSSRVFGPPLYFTLLKPIRTINYVDVYLASGLDWVIHFNTKKTGYDFATEFSRRTFDYVIRDDFFDYTLRRVGYDPDAFINKYMPGFDEVKRIKTHYLSNRGKIEYVAVYRRRNNEPGNTE